MRVHVLPPAECETADVVVCVLKGTPTPFSDNLEGVCQWCLRAVVFRPYTPAKPPRMCVGCVAKFLSTDRGATRQ